MAGANVYELAARFKIHRGAVSDHLHRNGVQVRRQGLDDMQIDQAVRRYAEGSSTATVGRHLGVGASTVLLAIRAHGVRLRDPRLAKKVGPAALLPDVSWGFRMPGTANWQLGCCTRWHRASIFLRRVTFVRSLVSALGSFIWSIADGPSINAVIVALANAFDEAAIDQSTDRCEPMHQRESHI